jgi:hypothetical protein
VAAGDQTAQHAAPPPQTERPAAEPVPPAADEPASDAVPRPIRRDETIPNLAPPPPSENESGS